MTDDVSDNLEDWFNVSGYDDLLAEMAKPKKKHNQNPPSNAVSLEQLKREQSERWHEEQADRETCPCKVPIPGSVYLGRARCSNCGRLCR